MPHLPCVHAYSGTSMRRDRTQASKHSAKSNSKPCPACPSCIHGVPSSKSTDGGGCHGCAPQDQANRGAGEQTSKAVKIHVPGRTRAPLHTPCGGVKCHARRPRAQVQTSPDWKSQAHADAAWHGRVGRRLAFVAWGRVYVNKMSARLGACLAATASHTRRAVQGWLWGWGGGGGASHTPPGQCKSTMLAAACALRGSS